MPGCVRKILEKAEEVVEGGFGRSKDRGRGGGYASCHHNRLHCQPCLYVLLVALGVGPALRAQWHLYPMSPLPVPVVRDCMTPGRLQPLIQLHPTHPTPTQQKHPRLVGMVGWSSEPSLTLHRESPSQPGEATVLPVPLGGVQSGVSSLGKRGFGKI